MSLYANNVFIQTLAQIHMPIIAWASHDLRALKKTVCNHCFCKRLKISLALRIRLNGQLGVRNCIHEAQEQF